MSFVSRITSKIFLVMISLSRYSKLIFGYFRMHSGQQWFCRHSQASDSCILRIEALVIILSDYGTEALSSLFSAYGKHGESFQVISQYLRSKINGNCLIITESFLRKEICSRFPTKSQPASRSLSLKEHFHLL